MFNGEHDAEHVRDEDACCAEYWRREADRLQAMVMDLREEIRKERAPITMMFQSPVPGGGIRERSIVRIPAEDRQSEVDEFPHLASWDWTVAGGVCFLLSPIPGVEAGAVAGGPPVAWDYESGRP